MRDDSNEGNAAPGCVVTPDLLGLGRPHTAPEGSTPSQFRYSLKPKDNVLTGSFDSAKLGTRTLTQFPQRVPRSRAETALLNRELDDMLASVRARLMGPLGQREP